MIRLENGTSRTPLTRALRDASFDIAKGEFVFWSGRPAPARADVALAKPRERPERGAVWVAGATSSTCPRPAAASAPQHRQRVPGLQTARQQDRVRKRRLRQEVIGSPARDPPAVPAVPTLSPGRQESLSASAVGRRAAACLRRRAFVNRPLILLADEPTGTLDPDGGASCACSTASTAPAPRS